jgi:hypothetical protein
MPELAPLTNATWFLIEAIPLHLPTTGSRIELSQNTF